MAESNGSTKGSLGQPPEQMSTETRLLLAFLAMGVILFLTQYFYKPATPPPDGKKSTQGQVANTAVPAATSDTSQPADNSVPAVPVVEAQNEPPYLLKTDLFQVLFSNQGANVHSWLLRQSLAEGKPLELVNTAATVDDPYPFSIHMAEHNDLAKKLNTGLYKRTTDPDGLGLTFEFSDGHTAARKTFRFEKHSFLVQVTSEVTNNGQPLTHGLEWRGGFGDFTLATPAAKQQTIYYDVTAGKLVEQGPSAAKNGPVINRGKADEPQWSHFSFAGIEDPYFTAVFLPDGSPQMQEVTFSDNTRTPQVEKPTPFPGASVSMGTVNHFKVFVGPKDYDLLKRLDPALEQLVNFGFMSILAKPLFLVVNWFNDNVVHNFGWAIVVVTVVINFLLFPLKLSNMKSMRKMQALKPQIDAINAKYKNIKMTDPRKGEQNQEVMDLYKKHGVNPMGGCVPMLLQIPFFFAFYAVLRVSVEMRGAPWLWIHDLSQAETLPIRILPVVMIASQFIMQKMTPQANVDPSQQKMMQFMPLIFGFMFYGFPSGLVLYYLTSNLVGMGQQWFFNQTEAATEAARSVEPPKKKNGRK